MPRRWTSFDRQVTNAEFAALPREDRKSLTYAMWLYGQEQEGGYVVSSYGKGLMMIKAKNKSQGRCLFFSVTEDSDGQVLTVLLVYKKESQEVPARVLETPRDRMRGTREN